MSILTLRQAINAADTYTCEGYEITVTATEGLVTKLSCDDEDVALVDLAQHIQINESGESNGIDTSGKQISFCFYVVRPLQHSDVVA